MPHFDGLICPDCGNRLVVTDREDSPGRCETCDRTFAAVDGVLQLVPRTILALTAKTVDQFGESWAIHDEIEPYHEKQFLDWISPMNEDAFAGKRVLECGCGKGRHTRLVASWGPEHLWAIDLSKAVFLARRNTRSLGNVQCLQADLLHLPIAPTSCDVVFSIGVLHHLEEPEAALRQFWARLKPGGVLVLWVYAREGNGWIVHLVNPIRNGLTSRIPTRLLRPLLLPLTTVLYLALKTVYGPATAWGKKPVRLPYSSYLGYISRFPWREVEHLVLDHMCPPIAHYLRRETLKRWLDDLGSQDVTFRWHNRNSWAITATKSARVDASPTPSADSST